ncbi:MAG: hypothetical protein ACXWZL_09515 [Mycobacterium sp.]
MRAALVPPHACGTRAPSPPNACGSRAPSPPHASVATSRQTTVLERDPRAHPLRRDDVEAAIPGLLGSVVYSSNKEAGR